MRPEDLSLLNGCPQPLPEGWDFTPLEQPRRVSEQVWPPDTRPWVSILTLAYQHAPFIRQALESFLMQETTFPVEIIVHDDASTDGTAEVLREYRERYPQLIRLVLQKENQYRLGRKGFPILYEMAGGFYVTLCDGDDYWTHPRKLQMQSALLEARKDLILCGHRIEILKDGCREAVESIEENEGEISFFTQKEVFMHGIFPPTLALFFRKEPIAFSTAFQTISVGDRYLMSHLCAHGGMALIPRVMAVYRLHSGGVYSMIDPVRQQCNLARSYRTLIREIPPRWAAASAVPLARLGLEIMRLSLKAKKGDAIGFGLKCYASSLWYGARGIRDGVHALPLAAESLARVLLWPWIYTKAILKTRVSR